MQKQAIDPSNPYSSDVQQAPYLLYLADTAKEAYKEIVRDGRLPISAIELLLLRTASRLSSVHRRNKVILGDETVYTGTFLHIRKETYQDPFKASIHQWSEIDQSKILWKRSFGELRGDRLSENPEYTLAGSQSKDERTLTGAFITSLSEELQEQLENQFHLLSTVYMGSEEKKNIDEILQFQPFDHTVVPNAEGHIYPLAVRSIHGRKKSYLPLQAKSQVEVSHGVVNVIAVKPNVNTRSEALAAFGLFEDVPVMFPSLLQESYGNQKPN